MKVILASASPRRKELFAQIIPSFEIIPSGIDESRIEEDNPVGFAIKVASAKAESVAKKIEGGLIISADTIVALNGAIIGKPKDKNDAYAILSRLSGTEHAVITGICVIDQKMERKLTDYEKTIVKMRRLEIEEIISYLSSEDWQDKAGAYAIQGMGDQFIEHIVGDYNNVVGLPLKKLEKLLAGITLGRR